MRRILIVLLIFTAIFASVYLYLSFEKQEDKDYLILYGNVDVRQVDLGFRASGRVDNMPFQEGDLVRKGQFMASLEKQPYLDQVREAKATVNSTSKSLEYAKKVFARRKELVGDGSISQEDFENTETNQNVLESNLKQAKAFLGVALTNLKNTEIYAPAEGTILTRVREPGTVVLESEPIYTLSLLSPVWIRAYVSEPQLGQIYPGMPAQIFTDTKNGPSYKGHIGFISPVAEFTPKAVETRQLRTDLVYRLRIIADNPDFGLRQGMPVTVKLPLSKVGQEEPSRE